MKFYIKEARERAGLSQKELAQIIGVAPSTFHGYESGGHDPKSELLIKIATACNVSTDFLLGNTPPTDSIFSIAKKAPSISDEAMKIANRYHHLDSYGKATVRAVMDEEENRIEEQSKLESLLPEKEPKIINLFLEPSAAGLATPVVGKDYEAYELTDNDPQSAAYAVRIRGDSMEPYFPDESIVFVNHDAIRDGDIGIFCVDGGTVCKQYHKRGGVVYLFSLNRNRSDADVVLFPDSSRSFVCQGRVITKRRYPLPGK